MRDPADELAILDERALRRRLRVPDDACQNFSGNDYLGLSTHPEVVGVVKEAIGLLGVGSGSSRLICGTSPAHEALESRLAREKHAEAALTFSSGYAASTGVLPALTGKGDVLILDKLCHASLIDGAKLSGATLRVFPHGDVDRLDHLLRWARKNAAAERRVIVVTESRFSMDGDRAPLGEIVDLKDRHGAWLLLDEAHAFGVDGPRGAGLAAEAGLSERVELQMGTLSKAVGLSGGFLAASRAVVDLLINRARSFIYSTAPPPALAVGALKAVEIIASPEGEGLRERLRRHIRLFSADGPIQPVMIGDESEALAAADKLRAAGFFVPAIRYPTVARSAARLRVTLSASHRAEDVAELLRNLP